MAARENLMIAALITLASLGCKNRRETNPIILIQTDICDISVEIYPEKAPLTVDNFLRYVDEERFTSASFYRVVRLDNQPDNEVIIEVIQGGIGFAESDMRLPPIEHETTDKTGILHTDGVISMARAAPGTASSEFFICVGAQPELDFGGGRNPDGQGFAAFGRVVKGMDVVHTIHNEPATAQMLVVPIRILGVRRMKKKSALVGSRNAGGVQ
jgi:peptidyl-prolyl cis-trans isomerase A (cyclophilin A)